MVDDIGMTTTTVEREDQRAATDPRYRRLLVARLRGALRRDSAPAAFLAAEDGPPPYEARAERLTRLGARVVPPPPEGGLALLVRTDREAWWRRLPAADRCQRRGEWTISAGWRSSTVDAPSPGYVWTDSGAPWCGGAPGKHRRDLSYVPAVHACRVRARWVWAPAEDAIIIDLLGERVTLAGPPPGDGERVTVRPDGRAVITRLDIRDGIQWRVGRPECVHGCAAAQRWSSQTDWLVTRGRASYHARGCATAHDAVRAAVAGWRAQRRAVRATAAELAAVRTRRVSVSDGMRAGYCRPGLLRWCADRGIRAERAESGIPIGVLLRRYGAGDPRVVRVCRVVAAD